MPKIHKLSNAEIRQLARSVIQSTDAKTFYEAELDGTLCQSGIWFSGLECPSCQDGKHDNFRICASGGGYFCQKCRIKGGDFIDFTRQRYGLNLFEAIQKITGGKAVVVDPAIVQKREAERLQTEQDQDNRYAQAAQERDR